MRFKWRFVFFKCNQDATKRLLTYSNIKIRLRWNSDKLRKQIWKKIDKFSSQENELEEFSQNLDEVLMKCTWCKWSLNEFRPRFFLKQWDKI